MTRALLAVSNARGAPRPDLQRARQVLGAVAADDVVDDGLAVVWTGRRDEDDLDASSGRITVPLSLGARRDDADVTTADISRLLAAGGEYRDLAELLPPFAAIARSEHGSPLIAAADALGFRHLYYLENDGWAAISTSAHALSALGDGNIDLDTVAIQSHLGWQVGLRTLFAGVKKLPPASVASVADGRLTITPYVDSSPPARTDDLDAAVATAADALRRYMRSYLADHPDAVLQLTGGQDSRILLGSLPPDQRRGLNVMTLAVAGSPDAEIAAGIAARYGMVHHVVDLSGLDALAPDEAHSLTVQTARSFDAAADALAAGSVAFAEAKLRHFRRIAGLGGEVARGFYYPGQPRNASVDAKLVDRLAGWRFFPNEAVATETLEPEFAAWAHSTALSQLHDIFAGYGPNWLDATDQFYLGQRMHRWAGGLASGTSTERIIVNPMLDRRFLDVARSMTPTLKKNSLFLSRLLCELDPELARIPMDGRPAPVVYAKKGPANSIRLAATWGRKAVNKARQRVFAGRQPPAGGTILAAKLTEYWREHPNDLAAVSKLGVFRESWLDQLVSG